MSKEGFILNYEDLKHYFIFFRLGVIDKRELAFAIGMWQRAGAML